MLPLSILRLVPRQSAGFSWSALLLLLTSRLIAADYYVNSTGDTSTGTESAPFQTLAQLAAVKLQPGDIVRFARGTSYTGSVELNASGTDDAPITITAYGSGPAPVLSNPGQPTVIVLNGDHVMIDGLKVQNTRQAAITLNGRHGTVQNCELTEAGAGLEVRGDGARVHRNYIHDMHMIRNTPGGDDDYGANGIIILANGGDYSANTIRGCRAPSHDYGLDGGAFEIYGHIADVTIRYNHCEGNEGVFEVGGGSATNILIHHNLCLNNNVLGGLHLKGKFGSAVTNFRFESNTVVETSSGRHKSVLWFNGVNRMNELTLTNNIFYFRNYAQFTTGRDFGHAHNLYFSPTGDPLGLTLGPGELNLDPGFVDQPNHNFQLQSSSPAARAGSPTGIVLDYRGTPLGSPPALGAFEIEH